ncbi:hypothetical protein [Paenibacillus piscarius]|uniref:hypothetical protein n=1 Tax=Paenibacillus piscarius TaxID=1089681 RepID=UPI001EE79CF4|nr:hypothetical protein [Paenibacillus piscarius]
MRQSPKAWIWSTLQGHRTGSGTEAAATAKAAEGLQELQGLQPMRRSLLPRS